MEYWTRTVLTTPIEVYVFSIVIFVIGFITGVLVKR